MIASLTEFARGIAAGRLRVVDFTQTLWHASPALQRPPQFGQVWAYQQERISAYFRGSRCLTSSEK